MEQEIEFPQGIIPKVRGSAIALRGDDIDTDRIIPARYLKCVTFDHLGENVFADDRNELAGKHPFDKEENQGSSILIVNGNFGCGSSREHAPQALMRWGIRAIIGESFAEIFYGNCLSIGLPCVTSVESKIQQMQEIAEANNDQGWSLDIDREELIFKNQSWSINIEQVSKDMFREGTWDATSKLISQQEALFEKLNTLPYLNGFNID